MNTVRPAARPAQVVSLPIVAAGQGGAGAPDEAALAIAEEAALRDELLENIRGFEAGSL